MDGIHRSSGFHALVLVEPALREHPRLGTGRSFRDFLVRDEASPEAASGSAAVATPGGVCATASSAERARGGPEIGLHVSPCAGRLVSEVERGIQEAADRHATRTLAELEALLQETVIAILENIGDPSHRVGRVD